ncbi:MAG: nucleoside deaminase [Bacteroidia bacterium]|nr:nucleoside deaminase [Bacteroidia bacterium]NND50935.1 nucleoside deaminase [Flavobacteriaceae bacterium]
MNTFMKQAILEAEKGLRSGGIPIGSVLVRHGKIVGRGHNRRIQNDSAILHAEMDAIENSGRQTADFYSECEIYTTLSPCSMCSGAILLYGIKKVIIGENETFVGEEELLRSRGVDLVVLNNAQCKTMMAGFIKNHYDLWNEDIGEE